jgi:hypothetical protein
VTACRDDSCPCGSGAAYEDCCLERETGLRRLVDELEGIVLELGWEVSKQHPEWYRARFGELYDGGVDAFGIGGPDLAARRDAELWFLLDCPLDGGGDTPLHGIRQRASGRSVELLARSELRAWRIESVDGAGVLGALCPLGSGRARLETARRPLGELRPGAIVVARSVPIGPGRWALLGRAPVVDGDASADFDALFAVLDSPRGEFWHVHGGVLARAAWAWPEDREHTLDGEIVEGSLATFRLADSAAAVAALEQDAELCADSSDRSAGVRRWTWSWDPPRRRSWRAERGARYTLCDEDAAVPPFLACLVLDLRAADGPDVSVLAPTPARLAIAERLLAARLGDALGPVIAREVDPPSVVPRWKRAAFERHMVPLPSRGRARRAA